MNHTLRIARPTDKLKQIAKMYYFGLEMDILSQFKDHAGFDGVILGHPELNYQIKGFK